MGIGCLVRARYKYPHFGAFMALQTTSPSQLSYSSPEKLLPAPYRSPCFLPMIRRRGKELPEDRREDNNAEGEIPALFEHSFCVRHLGVASQ